MVGPRAGTGVRSDQMGEIELIDDLHHEPRQMFWGRYSDTLAENRSGVSRSTVTKWTAMATTLVCDNPALLYPADTPISRTAS